MIDLEKIEAAVTHFVKGGDNQDLELLDSVLHTDFRITNDGFMGSIGITIIDKTDYLRKIESGEFGGLPRQMKILQIDQHGSIASVKLQIESAENDFISYNSLVLDHDNEWKIINNLAVVTSKK